MNDAVASQHAYYRRTASVYTSDHVSPGDEHYVALEYIAALVRSLRVTRILDVGSGTGRAVRFLERMDPGLQVVGLEPVAELRSEAVSLGGEYVAGSGEEIPFPDGHFDAVIATGVLHHVPNPTAVIEEMKRVARVGIFISDSNRYGQGPFSARVAKLLLYRLGFGTAIDYIRTKGRGYFESQGDGIYYSYSIHDSYHLLAEWADRTFVIPTGEQRRNRAGRMAESSHGLLVAVKEPVFGWAGRAQEADVDNDQSGAGSQ